MLLENNNQEAGTGGGTGRETAAKGTYDQRVRYPETEFTMSIVQILYQNRNIVRKPENLWFQRGSEAEFRVRSKYRFIHQSNLKVECWRVAF